MPPRPLADEAPTFTIPPTLLTPQSQAQQSLCTNANLLQLLHHRNKNQYRRSLWYRHFGLLRRETKKLCTDLGIALPSDATPREPRRRALGEQPKRPVPTRKQTQDVARQAATRRVAAWLEIGLVERWYAAFTTLLTTPSSAPLALTLLGILARVCTVTGLTPHIQSAAESEGAQWQVVEEFGDLEEEGKGINSQAKGKQDDRDDDDYDIGVAVARNQVGDDAAAPSGETAAPENTTTVARVKKKLGKRKRANAIDDLFAELS